MEGTDVFLLLILAVIGSIATRMFLEGIREGFRSEPKKILIEDIVKHIDIVQTIQPKSLREWWMPDMKGGILIRGLKSGIEFTNDLEVINVGDMGAGLRLCESIKCNEEGQSWGIFMPPLDDRVEYRSYMGGYMPLGITDEMRKKKLGDVKPSLVILRSGKQEYPPISRRQ